MCVIKARDLIVLPCETKDVRGFIEEHHYSKSINGVKIKHTFKIMHNEDLIGAVLFGAMSTTAWKKFGEKETHVIELRRLVLLDMAGKNSESRVISKCIKWIKKHDSESRVIVSYADPQYGHTGVIYKASNFEFIGMSGKDKGFKDTQTGKIYHSRALRTKYKGDYKPFVKVLRKRLEDGLLIPIDLPPKYCYIYKI